MRIKPIIIGLVAGLALAGCQWNDLERAAAGAAGGAVIAGATGGNPVTGAVIGGAAGALCDDVNVQFCK